MIVTIESENFQGSANYRPVAGNPAFPDTDALRDYDLIRTRQGVVANFAWHPSETIKRFLRGTYS